MTKAEHIEDLETFQIQVETFNVALSSLADRMLSRFSPADCLVAMAMTDKMELVLKGAPDSIGIDYVLLAVVQARLEGLPGKIKDRLDELTKGV